MKALEDTIQPINTFIAWMATPKIPKIGLKKMDKASKLILRYINLASKLILGYINIAASFVFIFTIL